MCYIEEDFETITREITELCEEKNIFCIITLAKKGTLLFKKIIGNDFIELLDGRIVTIYSDRNINKRNDYSMLQDKNILLFDDSMKTGTHFQHTIKYLLEKIYDSNDYSNKLTQFFCYSVVQYDSYRAHDSNFEKNLYSFKKVKAKEYYKFCLEEAYNFQKDLTPSSLDLPIYTLTLKNIDDLKTILMNSQNMVYQDCDTRIGNHKINLASLIIDTKDLIDYLDGFALASTCKIRYEYDNENDEYNVLITPFLLADSILYVELYELYQRLFARSIEEKYYDPATMNKTFVMLYRSVIFFISYYIGSILSDVLRQYGIDMIYTENCLQQFGYDIHSYVISCIDNPDYYLLGRLRGFHYTSKKERLKSNQFDYSISRIKQLLFDEIVDSEEGIYFKDDINTKQKFYEYKFIELNSLSHIFSNSLNLKRFVSVLISYMEQFALSNEIEIDLDKKLIRRGFVAGECSMTVLPFDDRYFYYALHLYYERSKKNLVIYLHNYDKFIKRLYSMFNSMLYFQNKLLVEDEFYYLADFFKKVNEQNFHEKIESKDYLINDEKYQNDIQYISEGLNLLLSSDDFEFN